MDLKSQSAAILVALRGVPGEMAAKRATSQDLEGVQHVGRCRSLGVIRHRNHRARAIYEA